MKVSRFIALFILISQFSFSQSGAPLKENRKMYLKGNSIIIGNNILGHHRSKPLTDNDIANDLVKMKYIDVDDDKSTFSSSEADIDLTIRSPKIAYAALYWSALYPYEKGVSKTSGNKIVFNERGKRDSIINSILFKTPNAGYTQIIGETIYDSFKSKSFESNMPYVCYADVTAHFQALPHINGTYTVANIRATEGQISGGGSAGWLLYIIYEEPSESLKYFTSYDGLIEVNKEPVEVSFKDFKNKEEGNIQTTIAIGALEGDRKIKSDAVSIFSQKSDAYVRLSSALREDNNFFNSSITIGDKYFSARNPNSTNTLGFDLLKMTLPNQDNSIFNSTTTHAKLKFETRADRFYLYFVAFETELSQNYFEEIGKVQQQDSILKTEKFRVENEYLTEKDHFFNRVLRRESISVPGLEAGYYIVTNVFSVPENAQAWSELLKKNGLHPKGFVNPLNSWDYIYIHNNGDLKDVFEKWQEYGKLDYLKDIWVMRINL